MNFNHVCIAGNLTRDPELRYTTKGTAAVELSIAVNHKYQDASGQTKESVGYFGAKAFGKSAENLAQYFRKGQNIFIEGRLDQESWEDKTTGKKQSKTKILIQSWQFTERKNTDQTAKTETNHPETPNNLEEPAAKPMADDEVPF